MQLFVFVTWAAFFFVKFCFVCLVHSTNVSNVVGCIGGYVAHELIKCVECCIEIYSVCILVVNELLQIVGRCDEFFAGECCDFLFQCIESWLEVIADGLFGCSETETYVICVLGIDGFFYIKSVFL